MSLKLKCDIDQFDTKVWHNLKIDINIKVQYEKITRM